MKTQSDFLKRLNEDYQLRFLKELYEAQQRKANDGPNDPQAPNDLFIRPVLEYDGKKPYDGSLIYTSPDICVGGESIISEKNLIETYGKSYDANIALNRSNYIYVRAKNASKSELKDRVARLYYCESQYVCWPSDWTSIQTDRDLDYAEFGNISPDKVGANKDPFFWKNVKQPTAGEHYCLIAQIDNAVGTFNPRPSKDIQRIDFAAMLRKQCLWGQRNVNVFSKDPVVSSVSKLSTDSNKDREGLYFLMIQSTNAKGATVEISCSRNDSNGNPIRLSPTTIQDDFSVFTGCSFYMKKDFSAYATTYLHLNSVDPKKYPSINPTLYFPTTNAEIDTAIQNKLIDFHSTVKALDSGLHTEVIPLVSLGGVEIKTK